MKTYAISNNTKKRVTSQQRIILDYLKKVKTHPPAEIIYEEVRKKLPQISLGTVYRNLIVLKNSGDILEIPLKGVSCYDGETSHHSHFICNKCGKIQDVFAEILKCEQVEKEAFELGEIEDYKLYFYGRCNKCGS